ncbi:MULTISPECIES: cupin domain-containing protein [Bacillaceae]|uniref:Cupin n=2 Tax=Bacillaceae TaxID=186817 RepID=A0A223KQG6_9BACI|nr:MULTISPECIES: cupin domain-containing protein [Sutcliffiella]AST91709.1 cupin [Sutcliffiella cohnii]WBL12927.1 cupin domain-containing protein [Sutcliffiella sp. NC1]
MNNTFYISPYYSNAYYGHGPICNHGNMFDPGYGNMSYGMRYANQYWPYPNTQGYTGTILNDYGKEPFVVNINQAARQNNTFRTTIWTGDNLQVTLMSINVGEDIGLEVHPDVDQFLRIEEGQGFVQMGESRDQLNFVRHVYDDSAIMVPAGMWHNLTNTGNIPLKLYTIYAPPEHPFGTVHRTKSDAEAIEG